MQGYNNQLFASSVVSTTYLNVKIKYGSNQNVWLSTENGENNTARLVLPYQTLF